MNREQTVGLAKIVGNELTITTSRGKTVYVVADCQPDPRVAYPAYSLTKLHDGTVYHVCLDCWGYRCDCADWEFCRANDGRLCKHLLAVKAVGLLP